MKPRHARLAIVLALALLGCGGRPPAAQPAPSSAASSASAGSAGSAVAGNAASEEDAAIPISSDDPTRGSRLAPVTLVVFSDFECPFCGRLVPTLDRLEREYEGRIRVVFKNEPLPFHRHARIAAEVGQGVLALAGPEAFWRYHDMAFERQASLSPEAVRSWAAAAGADPGALEEGLRTNRWAPKVAHDLDVARRVGADGTPTTFVNGVVLSGAQPYESVKEVVDAELAKANAELARGTPADRLYATLVAANFAAPPPAPAPAPVPEADRTVFRIPAGTAPARGPDTAEVTIIAFSDFQCPFCARVEPTLDRLRTEYGDKVRVLWRDTPLSFHARAEPAAQLARFARAQRGDAGFWDVHDRLFESQSSLEDADLERIAREAKLDPKKAMAAVRAKTFKRGIEEDLALAADFDVRGTPHFFINGRRLVGARPFEQFKAVVDEELAKAAALLQQGTPRPALYDALTKDGVGPSEPERGAIAPAAPRAPFRGAANAPLVIHQVSDFECPFCKRVEGTVDALLAAYPGKIKVVWRDKPLPMHPHARLAAEAAREAHAQKGNDGFVKMQRMLFDNQQALERADLDGYAKSLGLDMKRFAHALDTHAHAAAIEADEKATDAAGVNGTPAFFIGPYVVSGAQPLAKFKRAVDRALAGPR